MSELKLIARKLALVLFQHVSLAGFVMPESLLVANDIGWCGPNDSDPRIDSVTYEFQSSSFYLLESENAEIKDTLLHLLGLLKEPTSGEIVLEGQHVTGLNPEELGEIRNRKFGFLFSSPFLLPAFTVLENVAMPLFKIAQVDAREAKRITEMILSLVGIMPIVEVSASRLSPFHQQLTALARAIVHHPRLLIVQELGLNLSIEDTMQFLNTIRQIPDRLGTTVIATLAAEVDFPTADVVLEIGAASIREMRRGPGE